MDSDKALPLSTKVATYIERATADNTRRSYQSSVRQFLSWGGSLPTTPETLAAYMINRVESGMKVNSLKTNIAGIGQWHTTQGFDNPASTSEIRKLLKGMSREHGTAKRKAKPLTLVEIINKVEELLHPDACTIDIRDAALLSIGYFGIFRPDELVSVKYEDLEWCDEGLIITLPRSKTDKTGKGTRKAIARMPEGTNFCALEPLKIWLDSSDIKSGHIFRGCSKSGAIGNKGLCVDMVGRIVKKRFGKQYRAYSLRRGCATEASKCSSFESLKRAGGWRTDHIVREYVEEVSIFESNVTRNLLGNRCEG